LYVQVLLISVHKPGCSLKGIFLWDLSCHINPVRYKNQPWYLFDGSL